MRAGEEHGVMSLDGLFILADLFCLDSGILVPGATAEVLLAIEHCLFKTKVKDDEGAACYASRCIADPSPV